MNTARAAAKNVADESNPRSFVRKLRGLPVIKQILRVVDRFL